MNIIPVKVILPLVEFDSVEAELVVAWLKNEAIDIHGKTPRKTCLEIAEGFASGELECRAIPDSSSPRSPITFEKRRIEFVLAGQGYRSDSKRPVFALQDIQRYIWFHKNGIDIESSKTDATIE